MDFSAVNDRLGTGAALSGPEDAQAIAAAGYTHILDVTDSGDDTPLFVKLPRVHVLWNPTADDGVSKSPAWFKKSLDFALPVLALPHVKVYAHCSAGVNRGPSTAYCIMRALGFAASDAETIIRLARPQVQLAYKADADKAIPLLGYS